MATTKKSTSKSKDSSTGYVSGSKKKNVDYSVSSNDKVTAINKARAQNIADGKDAYSGAGATKASASKGKGGYDPAGNYDNLPSFPKLDIIKDDVTGNSYARDMNDPNSTYQLYTPPVEPDMTAQTDALAASTGAAVAGKGLVASSDKIVARENQTKTLVAGMMIPSTAESEARKASERYMKTLDDYSKYLEKQRDNQLDGINADYQGQREGTKDSQGREYAGFNTALTRVGGYLGTQISGVGALQTLATKHRAELEGLEVKKNAALQAANDAINEKQFKLAEGKANEAKSIAKTITDMRQQFFDNTLKAMQEERLQQSEQFKQSLDKSERVAVTLHNDIQGMDDETARKYVTAAANDLGIDANILFGEVNKISQEADEKIQSSVLSLASKYPSAGISPADSWDVAQAKVRGSREYQLDIASAEQTLANARNAGRESSIDYSSGILKMYSDATGKVVTSPSEAKGVMGYAEAVLADKEIVSDDTPMPALTPGRIRESDAKKMLGDAFSKFGKADAGIDEGTVWSWLASPEAQAMDDASKKQEIMSNGHNPEDFGIY